MTQKHELSKLTLTSTGVRLPSFEKRAHPDIHVQEQQTVFSLVCPKCPSVTEPDYPAGLSRARWFVACGFCVGQIDSVS